ncbi:hypothetical protein [Nitratifractor sp.]|uniref:hypothetical protein n=1 Tax=Nitratifractor sp. TaxID=2268144 RepID=UPI0025D99472|nr:hypothetical protein [Nitratifractor sp.]
MKIFLILVAVLFAILQLEAGENNRSDANLSSKTRLEQQHIKEQMEREKKYAKEQKFYEGKEYNLSEHKVDAKELDDVPTIEPDYDFDITDVYRDDQ